MNSNTIIVDVQGFKDAYNQFIIKEFALACNEYTQTFYIKPPYPYSKLSELERNRVRWIERNFGYKWTDGYMDYIQFRKVIIHYLENKKVFVKGLEKRNWVQALCSNCIVIDLSEKGCPNLKKICTEYCKIINFTCVYNNQMCALKHALCLREWCRDNCLHN